MILVIVPTHAIIGLHKIYTITYVMYVTETDELTVVVQAIIYY